MHSSLSFAANHRLCEEAESVNRNCQADRLLHESDQFLGVVGDVFFAQVWLLVVRRFLDQSITVTIDEDLILT